MAVPPDRPAPPRRVRRTASTIVNVAPPASDTVDMPVVGAADDYVAREVVSARTRARRGGIRETDVTVFLRQLIMLLEAGTPILRSLRTLSNRGERASVRALVADITEYVEMGNPLWQAFDRHPQYFDTVFVNLIKASEASGQLTTVLRRVVDYREERALLQKRVRSAGIYPVILIVACLGVLLLLSKVVIPQFEAMYKQADIEIAPWSRVFLNTLVWFGDYGWWITILAVVAVIAVYKLWYVRNPVRRLTADRVKIGLPVIGPILHKNALVELTRTMALLLRSGLSMMSTLDLTRAAIHNRAVAQKLQAIRDSVERGGGLEAPMREAAPVIPEVVTDMFVTGEETGRVDQIAEQIAKTYDEEVKIAIDNIGTLIQPILTVFIGVLVIMLFIGLFLPMIQMLNQLNAS